MKGLLAPGDARHGSTNGYWNFDCRCRRCRAAHSVYKKRYRVRLAARVQRSREAAQPGGRVVAGVVTPVEATLRHAGSGWCAADTAVGRLVQCVLETGHPGRCLPTSRRAPVEASAVSS